LQKDLQALLGAEGRDFLDISRPGRLQHAEYQRGRRVAGRHLHLRYFFSDGQRLDQCGKVAGQGSQGLQNDLTAPQIREVGFFRVRGNRQAPVLSCAHT